MIFFFPLNFSRKRVIHCYKLNTTDSFPTLPNARSYKHSDIRRYKTKLFEENPTITEVSSIKLVHTTAVTFQFVQQRCFLVTASVIKVP